MAAYSFDGFTGFVTQAGALGLASLTFVESLKGSSDFVGIAGFRFIAKLLGPEGFHALDAVYGEGSRALLKQTYRTGPEELTSFLRQGLNLAVWELPEESCKAVLVRFVQNPDLVLSAIGAFKVSSQQASASGASEGGIQLAGAVAGATKIEVTLPAVNTPGDDARRGMALLDTAIEARIRGAVAEADRFRTSALQMLAAAFALGAALFLCLLEMDGFKDVGRACFIGLTAVPIAPISKDLLKFLQAAKDSYIRK